jgi:hypothetical protein
VVFVVTQAMAEVAELIKLCGTGRCAYKQNPAVGV